MKQQKWDEVELEMKEQKMGYYAASSFIRRKLKKLGLKRVDITSYLNIKQGFTQRQLSSFLHISQSTISYRLIKVRKSGLFDDRKNPLIPALFEMRHFVEKWDSHHIARKF